METFIIVGAVGFLFGGPFGTALAIVIYVVGVNIWSGF